MMTSKTDLTQKWKRDIFEAKEALGLNRSQIVVTKTVPEQVSYDAVHQAYSRYKAAEEDTVEWVEASLDLMSIMAGLVLDGKTETAALISPWGLQDVMDHGYSEEVELEQSGGLVVSEPRIFLA